MLLHPDDAKDDPVVASGLQQASFVAIFNSDTVTHVADDRHLHVRSFSNEHTTRAECCDV